MAEDREDAKVEMADRPHLDEDKWVENFVALLKAQAPDKTDDELDKFAREMFAEARRRGEAMSEIDVEEDDDDL